MFFSRFWLHEYGKVTFIDNLKSFYYDYFLYKKIQMKNLFVAQNRVKFHPIHRRLLFPIHIILSSNSEGAANIKVTR